MVKKCNICGREFEAKNRRLGCSEQCIKEAHNIKKLAWKNSNKTREINNLQKSYSKNRSERIKQSLKWQTKNKAKANAIYAKRRARKLQSQIGSFEDEIRQIFKEAKTAQNTDGKKRHVHHIIPLQQYEEIVCGLHVPWNLEVLTEDEHMKAHEELRKKYGSSGSGSKS
jgi:Fe-S-cluster-containing dehydrogenase component